MAPQQNSVEVFGVKEKNLEKRKKGRSMPIIKVVRSVRSGHLVILFSF